MAKGNLFLGMGRGKVGDVVFYRMNGWQMARVRNRNPKNPRSNEQLYQRAVIATVMKAYSAGKEIFDHSFQGYTVGEGCMRRFNSVNANILRNELVNAVQMNWQWDETGARFVAPKSPSFVPFAGMQISEGTLNQNLFHTVKQTDVYYYSIYNPSSSMKVNDLFKQRGINAGDIFTFVLMVCNKDEIVYKYDRYDSENNSQYKGYFQWVRLIVRDDISDELMTEGATYGQIFNIEKGGDLTVRLNSNSPVFDGNGVPLLENTANFGGCIGCIRSRDDMDLRSTEFMIPYKSNYYGITPPYVLEIWQMEVKKVGQSDLILEGGDNLANYNARSNEDIIVDAPVDEAVLPKRGRTKA